MALGTFTPPASGSSTSFDPRTNHSKPLIVVVREHREDFVTRRYPTPKPVVFADVVDLMADTVNVGVIWGGGAMVDRLSPSVPAAGQEPEKLPVAIVPVQSGNGGTYYSIEPLEGTALQLAAAWDQKNPTRIDDERAAKLAADQANAAKPQGNGNGQAPSGQAPISGLGAAQQTAAPETAPAAVASSAPMNDAALEAALAALS